MVASLSLDEVVEQVSKTLDQQQEKDKTNPTTTSKWKFVFYDNGGQDVFQTPNALFLTDGCLIVLVFDMHQVSCFIIDFYY